jgi:hypothetical protein
VLFRSLLTSNDGGGVRARTDQVLTPGRATDLGDAFRAAADRADVLS